MRDEVEAKGPWAAHECVMLIVESIQHSELRHGKRRQLTVS
jgi:hypothetical protein